MKFCFIIRIFVALALITAGLSISTFTFLRSPIPFLSVTTSTATATVAVPAPSTVAVARPTTAPVPYAEEYVVPTSPVYGGVITPETAVAYTEAETTLYCDFNGHSWVKESIKISARFSPVTGKCIFHQIFTNYTCNICGQSVTNTEDCSIGCGALSHQF